MPPGTTNVLTDDNSGTIYYILLFILVFMKIWKLTMHALVMKFKPLSEFGVYTLHNKN